MTYYIFLSIDVFFKFISCDDSGLPVASNTSIIKASYSNYAPIAMVLLDVPQIHVISYFSMLCIISIYGFEFCVFKQGLFQNRNQLIRSSIDRFHLRHHTHSNGCRPPLRCSKQRRVASQIPVRVTGNLCCLIFNSLFSLLLAHRRLIWTNSEIR